MKSNPSLDQAFKTMDKEMNQAASELSSSNNTSTDLFSSTNENLTSELMVC